jgi:hypothetical protein
MSGMDDLFFKLDINAFLGFAHVGLKKKGGKPPPLFLKTNLKSDMKSDFDAI